MRRKADRDFLAGGGDLGALMRAKAWGDTPLGPEAAWPQSLRTAVSILLNSRYPMFIFWGPQLIKIYNDGYRPILGDKHPWALGRPGKEIWPEIWSDIGPLVDRVVRDGEATWSEDLRLYMHRRGFPEEVFFTFSYSPIRDESGGVGGMFCACTETTAKVRGERRLKILRDLAAASIDARSVSEVCARSAEVLRTNPADMPSAEIDLDGRSGWEPGKHESSFVLALPDSAGEGGGRIRFGLSPHLALDDEYRGFFGLVAGQVASSIASARAAEAERKRAEALAELDRAKTAFFSNVSHELRTPLTLMLGPVDDALADGDALAPAQRERLELARRSGLRLQKLVNTLLDFARIEAGRAQASYQPTDLAAFTAELASCFRSAVEKAGLALQVDCPRLDEPAYVDRDMWEKIVLNLLSNAFKFTFAGSISVRLRQDGDRLRLSVADTGTGIPAGELPHVFERFRRVEGARSRTHEGTGIGLSLVQELVRLHGGAIEVESGEGAGSTFTVSIPAGYRHLPRERVGAVSELLPTPVGATAFVEEALHWLPEGEVQRQPAHARRGARIVWADDNADMREYVRRLLVRDYEVEAVPDGEAALAAIRRDPPELLLADVMMPKLDGFGLLAALRADERTRDLPVVLLSARAGEEAQVEGLEAGAHDYLVKPFSARELLARIQARLSIARLQRQIGAELADTERLHALSVELVAETDLDALYGRIVDAAASIMRSQFASLQMLHPERGPGGELRLLAFRGFSPQAAAFWEWVRPDSESTCGMALRTGERVVAPDVEQARYMAGSADLDTYRETGIRAVQTTPLVSRTGVVVGMLSTHWSEPHAPSERSLRQLDILARQAADLIERRLAEAAVRRSDAQLRRFADTAPAILWTTDPSGACTFLSRGWYEFTGQSEAEALGFGWTGAVHPEDRERADRSFREASARREPYRVDYRLRRRDGEYRWAIDAGQPHFDERGEYLGIVGSVIDVHERKTAEDALRASEERYRRMLGLMPAAVYTCEAPSGVITYYNDHAAKLWGRAPATGETDERFCGSYRLWRPDGSLLPHDRTPMALAMLQGESFRNQEVVIERPDGSRVTVLVNIDPLRDAQGRITGAINVFHDVSERRRVAEALKASEERYRAVVESQSEMVCRFRPDGTILFVNGAYARSLGTTVEALTGKDFWAHIPEADHAGIRELLARMTHDSPEVRIENRFVTTEGERWTLWTNRALAFDAAGRVTEVQSAGIDITERKRAEEALLESDRRKDEFLAILSHELRNPLAPISNALTLLHQADDDEAVRHQARAVLDRQVRHLIRLVDDLLDVSRIGRGDVGLQKRLVRVSEVLGSALETSRPRVESGGHALGVEQAEADLSVEADPVRLSQVIANLINNAAAYTPHGGRIDVAVRRRGGQAEISVRDNGVGIAPEELASLFGMFRRGDVAKQHPSGFGIGLALSRRLVEMHGGTIEASSEGVGRGSQFIVRLPLASRAGDAPAGEERLAASTAPRRILVVDDNRDAADSLGLVLRTLGAEVRVAHDGPGALAEFDAHAPSVVLLDIGMPGMSGYEVARAIRSRDPGRNAALVALTGWGQEEDRRRARDAGFDHHIVKPAEIEALQDLLAGLR